MESNLWDHFKNLEEPHRLTHILFFQLVDKDSFNRCFMSWVSSVAREVEGRTVSIDGKTIRCASKMSDDALPIHILSAWADENRMVIAQLQLDWQEGKDKQENEIVAVPKLIDMLNIKGAVVTADAIGTQTAIAKIHSERLNKRTGETTREDRYFITTLTDTERMMNAVRSHWDVESMHWMLDMDFGEDHSAKRACNAAANFNATCKTALNLQHTSTPRAVGVF